MATGERRWFPSRLAIELTILPVLALLSGCVSGADGPSPTDPHGFATTGELPTTTTVSIEAGLDNYQRCLSEQGVVVGEISLDGKGRPRMAAAMREVDFADAEVLDALEHCGPELSTGALGLEADPELRHLVVAELEAFAACIRSQGVPDYPDPVPGFNGVGAPYHLNRVPWTDPELPDAVTVCSSQLHQGP